MAQVKVREGNIEKAIQAFRKRVEREGTLKALRHKRSFESKGEKRKRKDRESTTRRLKNERRRVLTKGQNWSRL